MQDPFFCRLCRLLFVLCTLLVWTGPQRVFADERPLCGAPLYNNRKDRGIFLWNKCLSNTTWYLRSIAGGKDVAVSGTLVPIDDINVKIKSSLKLLEKGIDSVNATNFNFQVGKRNVDGFNFILRGQGEACLTVKSPEDTPLFVGNNRVTFPKSISLPSFKPCIEPLLEYNFDGDEVTKDTGTKGWNGQIRGKPSLESVGFSNKALRFNGRSDHMLIPQSRKLHLKSYTMMAWVRYVGTDEFSQVIFQKPFAAWLVIHQKSGKVRAGGHFGGCGKEHKFKVESYKQVPTETWTHVAATYDGNTLRIYVNGKLSGQGSPPTRGFYCVNNAPFDIGSYQESKEQQRLFFKGYMDSVRIYNVALSQDQVRLEMFKEATSVEQWQPMGQVLHGTIEWDWFGTSVSLSRDGTVMAVGATQERYRELNGYVTVNRFDHSKQMWSRIGRISGRDDSDHFGSSVSLNGDGTILAVGADEGSNAFGKRNPGYVRVYKYNAASDTWEQLGNDIFGLRDGDMFGFSVSLSEAGDILAVGEPKTYGSARLFKYNRDSSSWNQLGQTLGTETGIQFGTSVSLSRSGNIVGVGALQKNKSTGQVSVFEYDSSLSKWQLLGEPINGDITNGKFGASVSLDDSGLIVAAGGYGSTRGKGRVSVYVHDGSTSTWNQRGQTIISKQLRDSFGRPVSLSGNGNVLAIGSTAHDANDQSREVGQVLILQYDTTTEEWSLVGDPLNGEAEHNHFGRVSLSSDGRIVGIGASGGDANGRNSGSAHAFRLNI